MLAAYYAMFKTRLINRLAEFIPSVEGFRAHPYWDVSRYSWGYGTAAPGSTGTITREQAFADMVSHFLNDYAILKDQVTRQLTINQWTAFLSFSYNEGVGRADNLIDNINSHNDQALATQWRKYNIAGGQVSQVLIDRREKELALWFS